MAVSFESIIKHFESLSDPRHTRNRRHERVDVRVIAVSGVIVGCDGPTSIERWAEAKEDWRREWLAWPHGIPSRDCIRRVLSALKPEALRSCFQSWIAACLVDREMDSQPTIAIDGKTLRRSHDRAAGLGPLHWVSAWASEHGLALGQVATEEKSNEITAIPERIEKIDVKGAIVTIDVMGCQKEIARKIVAEKGYYVLAVKENQPKLVQANQVGFPRAPGKRSSARAAPPTRDARNGSWPQRRALLLSGEVAPRIPVAEGVAEYQSDRQAVRFPELADDLLRCVSFPLHRKSPCPAGQRRLSDPLDQVLGSRPQSAA